MELAGDALKMGASGEFVSFAGYLKTKGANDVRERMINSAGARFFEGPGAAEARKWLASLESGPMKMKFSAHAGSRIDGAGLRDFLESLRPDKQCQSAALASYCRTLARTDPSGAVKTFQKTASSIGLNFAGIEGIMAALPPTADFSAIAGDLPEDGQSVARRARSALLKSWAVACPEDAAQYVISNTTLASPDQMAVVVGKWVATAPGDAAAWMEALSAGVYRDTGMAALATHWAGAGQFAKAWDFATKLGDRDKRIKVATAVFQEWGKTDKAAAEKAWLELFPPGK